MSGLMSIRFAPDMPAAAVEVVGPDLESVGRVWLKPNGQTSLEVPSEASFLRVHLAGGRIVTLDQPGSLDRIVSQADILPRLPRPPAAVRQRDESIQKGVGDRAVFGAKAPTGGDSEEPPGGGGDTSGPKTTDHLPDDLPGALPLAPVGSPPSFELSWGKQEPLPAQSIEQNENGVVTILRYAPPSIAGPYRLIIQLGDLEARIRLPGRLDQLEVRPEYQHEHRDERRWKIVVRARTKHPVADTVGGYLNRGDLHSASTLAASAETAEDLLQEKVQDPFAAVVGAYLLLRLRRLDLLHDWTYNLAMMFPEIPDVAIIRGWHLVQAGASHREAEIRACFAQAFAGPLPIFTEGLQLLSEGARLLGKEFQGQLEALNARCGVVQWSSPFTATTLSRGDERTIRPPALTLDVDYLQAG